MEETDLGLLGQRGVAAGEDQLEPLVGKTVVLSPLQLAQGDEQGLLALEIRLAAQAVDGLAAGDGGQPRDGRGPLNV